MNSIPPEEKTRARYEHLREFLARIHKAEEIDRRHHFQLPGDSALAIELWSMESELGDYDRSNDEHASRESTAFLGVVGHLRQVDALLLLSREPLLQGETA